MSEDVHLAALRWQQAIDAGQIDWPGFTLWLEADPGHRRAFDAVAAIEDAIARHGTGMAPDHEGSPADSRYSAAKPM